MSAARTGAGRTSGGGGGAAAARLRPFKKSCQTTHPAQATARATSPEASANSSGEYDTGP